MNELLSVNPGLASRFPEEMHFAAFSAEHNMKILKMKLTKYGISMRFADHPGSTEYQNVIRGLESLSKTPSWGNARDVETVAKDIYMQVLSDSKNDEKLVCSSDRAVTALQTMLSERRMRKLKDTFNFEKWMPWILWILGMAMRTLSF